jgi:hypothetical protein
VRLRLAVRRQLVSPRTFAASSLSPREHAGATIITGPPQDPPAPLVDGVPVAFGRKGPQAIWSCAPAPRPTRGSPPTATGNSPTATVLSFWSEEKLSLTFWSQIAGKGSSSRANGETDPTGLRPCSWSDAWAVPRSARSPGARHTLGAGAPVSRLPSPLCSFPFVPPRPQRDPLPASRTTSRLGPISVWVGEGAQTQVPTT